MNFAEMETNALEERKAAIATECEADGADTAALLEEIRGINAELEKRKADAQAKEELRKLVANGAGNVIEEAEENKMPEKNVRSTFEYGRAFIQGVIKNDMTEARALLSTNGTNAVLSLTGYVPVPEGLENEVKTAWTEAKIPSLVKKSYFRGNLSVPFELSATGASLHSEGTNAPTEETVTLGIVKLIPQSIKKWITVSDEAVDLNPQILDYLYKEIAQKIVEKAEEEIVTKISYAPTTAGSDYVEAAHIAAVPSLTTISDAVAELSGQAKNLYIVMNRRTKPAFRALQTSANYNVDVWDGLEDRIIYTDYLPAYADADEDDAYLIVGDFGYGFQANFPNGDEITLKVDDNSLAEKDLIKIVGRQYVALNLVARKAFTIVNVPEEEPTGDPS